MMYSDSKVLGSAVLGDNVIIAANAYIKDEVIPDNSVVFGQSPNIVIKQIEEYRMRQFFGAIFKNV